MSQATGSGQVLAPPELIELDLMEKFGWTPAEISNIPYGKLQRIFIVMSQRDESREAAQQAKAQAAQAAQGHG
jgi:hypothetical protein